MTVIDWLGIVSGVISILAFIFAVWVWLRSDIKVRELEKILQAVYDVTGAIGWEMQTLRVDDAEDRLRNAERALGEVNALHAISARYLKNVVSKSDPGGLVERGVIWSMSMIWDIETSERTREVWFVSPDLEPDLSDRTTGNVVANNLKRGKKYVYFYPQDIPNNSDPKTKLLANIGALKSARLTSRVRVVPVDHESGQQIFRRGNIIVFFSEDSNWETGRAFEEIVMTKLPERGMFWQEYSASEAEQLKIRLKQQLDSWNDSPASGAQIADPGNSH